MMTIMILNLLHLHLIYTFYVPSGLTASECGADGAPQRSNELQGVESHRLPTREMD
jgi:hypothetical protein